MDEPKAKPAPKDDKLDVLRKQVDALQQNIDQLRRKVAALDKAFRELHPGHLA